MLTSSKPFTESGKPSQSAIEICEMIKSEMALKARCRLRLQFKTYREHIYAICMLVDSRIKFWAGSDACIGDDDINCIKMRRAEARKFLKMIEKAASARQ